MAGTIPIRRSLALALAALCLALPACNKASKKLTQANFDQIQSGMSLSEVQTLLGGPGEDEGDLSLAEGSSAAGAVGIGGSLESMTPKKSSTKWYKWGNDSKFIKVAFAQDKVAANNFKQSQGLK